MTHTLAATLRTSHLDLIQRMQDATRTCLDHSPRRDVIAAADGVLISTSRHVSAVCAVLLPAIRDELEDGALRSRRYLARCRQLEHRLMLAKRHLYGDALGQGTRWSALWHDLQVDISAQIDHDEQLLEALLPHVETERRMALGARLAHAVDHAPSRPHPHLPHVGRTAAITRRAWHVIDQIWDTLENRGVARPRSA